MTIYQRGGCFRCQEFYNYGRDFLSVFTF